MSPNFNAGFVILDSVTVTDITQGRRITNLAPTLTDDDALRALQCVARNDVDFAAYMKTMRKVVAVSALIFDGQTFTVKLHLNINSERDCLERAHAMCQDWDSEIKQYSLDADLVPHLCLRSLAHEEDMDSLFKLEVTSASEVFEIFEGKSPQTLRLWVRDVSGNNEKGWLDSEELEACCLQGQDQLIKQHCRVKMLSVSQLFMKYWVASGKLSKVKYRSLSKALNALFASTI